MNRGKDPSPRTIVGDRTTVRIVAVWEVILCLSRGMIRAYGGSAVPTVGVVQLRVFSLPKRKLGDRVQLMKVSSSLKGFEVQDHRRGSDSEGCNDGLRTVGYHSNSP